MVSMFTGRVAPQNALLQAISRRRVIALLAAANALACDKDAPTDTAREVPRAAAPRAAIGNDVALGQADETPPTTQAIPLPVNQLFNSGGVAFRINQTGTGPNGNFTISNTNSAATALHVQSNGSGFALRGLMTGTGRAAQFETTHPSNNAPTLAVKHNGLGNAAVFEVSNIDGRDAVTVTTNATSSLAAGLRVIQDGEGPAAYFQSRADNLNVSTLEVMQLGTGAAGVFTVTGGGVGSQSPAIEATSNFAGSAALFRQIGGGGPLGAVEATTTCDVCPAGKFSVTSASSIVPAFVVTTNGYVDSWAGVFNNTGLGGGVQITTNGGPGLQVVGGSKNAVVRTRDGSRALYTEESTEVWFTDYGFGRLASGHVRVRLDPQFSETVALGEPYHVFVQPYGRAEIYVTNRNRSGFDVVLKDGEPNVEFSYRIVAKRLGFESKRLERAQWADRAAIAGRAVRQARVTRH